MGGHVTTSDCGLRAVRTIHMIGNSTTSATKSFRTVASDFNARWDFIGKTLSTQSSAAGRMSPRRARALESPPWRTRTRGGSR